MLLSWLKAFHVIFMVAWFAGLFYLPRLFVYHATASDVIGRKRFDVMEKRLFGIMSIGAAGTLLFGGLLFGYGPWRTYVQAPWMHAKLTLVFLLLCYHAWLYLSLRRFADGRNQHGQLYYRIANEVPSVLLIGIVILVVVKPF